MGASGRERAEEFSWRGVARRVDEYYGFVVRRLAAQGALPRDFTAAVPPATRPLGGPVGGAAVGSAAGSPPEPT